MRDTLRPVAAMVVFVVLLGACSDATDESASVRGVSDTEITIGTHLDLSGPIVSWGLPMRNGMILAVEAANAAGGIHGRKIRFIVEDNGYSPSKAVLAVRKLIDRDRVFAIVGAIGSPTVLATLSRVLDKGILHLFPQTAARETYLPIHPLKFALNVSFRDASAAGVHYLHETHGITRLGILYQDDDYGREVLKGAKAALRELNLPFSSVSYKRGATDVSAQITRLRADGADALFLGTIVRETVAGARAAHDLGWRVPMVCPLACYTEETALLGGASVEGLYAVGQIKIPYADDRNPATRLWRKRYEERFSTRANLQARTGYMVMRIFLTGLEETGRELTQEAYAKTLEAMPPWAEADIDNPPVDYTPSDHLGTHQGFVAQVENGRWVARTGLIDIKEVE